MGDRRWSDLLSHERVILVSGPPPTLCRWRHDLRTTKRTSLKPFTDTGSVERRLRVIKLTSISMHFFNRYSFNKRIAAALVVGSILTTSGFAGTKSVANQRSRRSNEPAAKATVPAPRDVIGFTPGEDRKLASWAQIIDYFRKLARASNRVKFQELGKTTLGRPFVLATISSPENLARLERFKEIQRKL